MKKHWMVNLRRAGVPLVAVETADPSQSIAAIREACKTTGGADFPVACWDISQGLRGINPSGKSMVSWYDPAVMSPPEMLKVLSEKAGEKSITFLLNPHRFWDRDGFAQAIWLCRDRFKGKGAMLVMLCPAVTLPSELSMDVVIIREDLPDVEELGILVDKILSAVKEGGGDTSTVDKTRVVDMLLGSSAFSAEQSCAMASSKAGINLQTLFERKAGQVAQTPGLSLLRGSETFDELGGLATLKGFLTRILRSGRNPVRAVGFIDEIEKLFAASGTDTSGVSQDILRVFLTNMQDQNIPGLILIGPPGVGKSAIAKSTGNVAGAETIAFDTGGMKASLVGESEARVRRALAVFNSIAQGKGLFIATCNKITALPPELRRRFTLGTFYVDLPDAEERKAIWSLWRKRYSIPEKEVAPDAEEWTGAEVRACCDVAYRANMPLSEAAGYIVPVSKAAPEQVQGLRDLADGRFLSASHPGLYKQRERPEASGSFRVMDLGT
jgi:hypothetical protein